MCLNHHFDYNYSNNILFYIVVLYYSFASLRYSLLAIAGPECLLIQHMGNTLWANGIYQSDNNLQDAPTSALTDTSW